MSKVASEVKVPSHPAMRQTPRPADRVGTENPFAALLDSASAPERAPAPNRPDRPAPAQQSGKSDASDTPPSSAAPLDAKTAPDDAPVQASTAIEDPSQTATAATVTTGTDTDTGDTTKADDTNQIDQLLAAIVTPDASQAPAPAPAQTPAVAAAVVPLVPAPAVVPAAPVTDATDDTIPALPAIKAATPATAPDAPAQAASTDAPADETNPPLAPQAETGDVETAKPEANAEKPTRLDAKTDADAKVGEPGKTDPAETAAPDIQPQPRDIAPKSETPRQIKAEAEIAPQQNSAASKDRADNDTQPALKPQAVSAMNDSIQNVPQTLTLTPAHHANTTLTAAAQNATQVANAVPINGIAVEIAAQMKDGARRFEIRLDPPELGRIDVRLDVDKNGQVTSHLRVDRVETLDMLRRDSVNLERALQDAGLKTSDNALNFSLRDQSFRQHAQDQGSQNATQFVANDETMPVTAGPQQNFAWASRLGGIDIRV